MPAFLIQEESAHQVPSHIPSPPRSLMFSPRGLALMRTTQLNCELNRFSSR